MMEDGVEDQTTAIASMLIDVYSTYNNHMY